MRKIKFRAWITANGQARYVYSNDPEVEFLFSGGEIICFENYYTRTTIPPGNIEFFCGHDDNGDEVYEGDYLKIINPCDVTVPGWLLSDPLKKESALESITAAYRAPYLSACKFVLDKERSHRND